MNVQLTADDRARIASADRNIVVNALSRYRSQVCPPWLSATHPFPDGALPTGEAAFAAVSSADMLEVIAARGPLHVIDGWGYLGRAFSSMLSGNAHAARHMAYYAELRAALSILASSGIGVFNRRNAAVDATGVVTVLSNFSTHQMAWLALAEWSAGSASTERLIKPIQLLGASLLEPFREFFPGQVATAAGQLMYNLGFDLRYGAVDRDERNWSSYQPTALAPIHTSPAQDAAFLSMFWQACRPNGVELERHLLRILLETEARSHDLEVSDYPHSFERLPESTKAVIPFKFLTREDDPVDHDFILQLANRVVPAPPHAMMCRAGLLLKLATGMAEENLRAAGVQPLLHFSDWWQDFGANHGLWRPGQPPVDNVELWGDIDLALAECTAAPSGHRNEWLSSLAANSVRICETERAALWGLFR